MRLVVSLNEYDPVVNVWRLERSISYYHFIIEHLLSRMRLVVSLNEYDPVVNVWILERSIH